MAHDTVGQGCAHTCKLCAGPAYGASLQATCCGLIGIDSMPLATMNVAGLHLSWLWQAHERLLSHWGHRGQLLLQSSHLSISAAKGGVHKRGRTSAALFRLSVRA